MKIQTKIFMRVFAALILLAVESGVTSKTAMAHTSDDMIQSDDTAKAMIAVKDAANRKDLDLLMSSFKGRNVDVHIAALQAIEGLDISRQRIALVQILQQESLWETSFVEGEASTIKRTFANKVKQLAAKFTSVPDKADLLESTQRHTVQTALTSLDH